MDDSEQSWPRLPDIRQKVEKRWQRGDLLRAWLSPEDSFPWRIPLKQPSTRQISDRFEQSRDWVRHWQGEEAKQGFRLEWRDINHRQLGRNQLPAAVVFDAPEQALKLIGKLAEGRRFASLYQALVTDFPELDDWCRRRPLVVLDKTEDWPRLRAVLNWLREHPGPRIYLRQLEIPGVHTKFIEANRGLLAELLDLVLPADAIDRDATGASGFERRYGFLGKPAQIRFRILDPAHRIAGLDDLQIPVEDFNRLAPAVTRVFIVENEITALAFPPVTSALVIFGQGYGVDQLLAGASWLRGKQVFYWGDIDTHGFAILDHLRAVLPDARSLLMDRATLLKYRPLWGEEPTPTRRQPSRLTTPEQALYRDLLEQRLGRNVRLEQERIALAELHADGAF